MIIDDKTKDGTAASSPRVDNQPTSMVFKTRQDYLNEMILRCSGEDITPGLTPEKRAKALKKILDKKTTRHRFIFSLWPRPPGVANAAKMVPKPYEYMTPQNSGFGKMAPGGIQFWGSTLFDLYRVLRFPELPILESISTGSKLSKWVRENGEADGPAKNHVKWADNEKDPELIPVCSIAGQIQSQESYVRSSLKDFKEAADTEREKWALPTWPLKSVFDPVAYPQPWPSEPFSENLPWGPKRIPKLHQYIPQFRLPERLTIHDPWKLLEADEINTNDMPWKEKVESNPNSTHAYKLNPSKKYAERRKADDDEIAKAELRAKEVLEAFLANPHSSNKERPPGFESRQPSTTETGQTKPAFYVVLPPPPPLAAATEAHLYLSPACAIGEGNHSFVYLAEWELPRSCLVEEKLCMDCVQEDFVAIQKEEAANGNIDPKWDELSGNLVLKTEEKLPTMTQLTFEDGKKYTFELEKGCHSVRVEYEGPYRVVQSRVKYQNLERGGYCAHLAKGNEDIHPLTTKVRVAAKLSIQYDEHLKIEAENYQRFPKHFFQHWSGYQVVPPMNNPTPLGAIVPQFYGYYVPDTGDSIDSDGHKPNRGAYLSPVLLLESCGVPIKPEQLSIDDQHELIALSVRFHSASWYHGSFAPRNLLVQPGPLSEYPMRRLENTKLRGGYGVDWSFRMIDFGRSRYGGEKGGNGVRKLLEGERNAVRELFEENVSSPFQLIDNLFASE